ncbi:MAG: hypothetical protein IKA11_00490 [Clostridia bacterium]|nr:hypothetical protein [Clostridia bacterium]
MNEKLQYASMLEIPVNTCSVTQTVTKRKRNGKKKKVNPEAVKEELLNRINSQDGVAPLEETPSEQAVSETVVDADYNNDSVENGALETASVYSATEKKKKPFKFTVVGVQLAVIGVLIATIFLTNAFYADSGINVFLKSVFGNGSETEVVDARTYEDFAPVISVGDGTVAVEAGVISFAGKGSVYAPCDGTVSAVTQGDDGLFMMEITHSDNFKTVLSGLKHAYAVSGDLVYSNIPVGYYTGEDASMCFMSGDGVVISDYQIVDSSVVWVV